MGRLFWIIIAAIAVITLLLISNNESGMTAGFDNDVFARASYMGIWGIVLAAGLLGSGIGLVDSIRQLMVWAIIILTLVAGYQNRYELQDIGNRITAGLIPASAISSVSDDGTMTVTLTKSAGGHFEVNGRVNGKYVHFLIDTGASSIVLSYDDAQKVGIDTENLNFTAPIMTANGTSKAAHTRIDQLQIGDIRRENVHALVTQPDMMRGSLLGMSFLETLHGFNVRGDRLILLD
ncbi:TIGR02281 family clan AA aspartic protease [Brucellaceae bacterium C25G]